MTESRFGQAYFRRYYENPRTRVAEPDHFDRLARFIGAYLDFLDCEVRTVLDAGCGAGLLHAGLRRAFPGVRIEAFDVSAYACEKYGWTQSTIEDYESAERFDLVVCNDVLQYLERPRAEAALAKLEALTGSALYFGVLTREDWEQNCDQRLTDPEACLRTGRWYRRRLERAFHSLGGGLWIRRDAGVSLFELERA